MGLLVFVGAIGAGVIGGLLFGFARGMSSQGGAGEKFMQSLIWTLVYGTVIGVVAFVCLLAYVYFGLQGR